MSKVFFAELKKLLKLQHILLIFTLAISARIVFCFVPTAHDHPYSDEVYKHYTTQLSGELTDEKMHFLDARLAEIQTLIADYDSMQQKYQSGEIDLEEYSDFTARHGIAKAEEKTVMYLCEKYAKLNECSGFDKQVFCDTDWSDLFAENGYDYLMLIALLCIAVPAFDSEFSSGSFAQILTSKRGRTQTAFAKLFAVTLAVFVLASSFLKVQKKLQPLISIFRFVMVSVVSVSPMTVQSGKVSRKVFMPISRPLGETAVQYREV